MICVRQQKLIFLTAVYVFHVSLYDHIEMVFSLHSIGSNLERSWLQISPNRKIHILFQVVKNLKKTKRVIEVIQIQFIFVTWIRLSIFLEVILLSESESLMHFLLSISMAIETILDFEQFFKSDISISSIMSANCSRNSVDSV